MKEVQLTFLSEEPPVKVSPSQDSEKEWMTHVVTSRLPLSAWLTTYVQSGSYGKTSLVSCQVTEDGILEPSSGRWSVSGIACPGECWTLSTSESRKDADVCLLSHTLQEIGDIHPRYYLSAKACAGILRRAEVRGRQLPPMLKQALEAIVNQES